MQKDRVQVIAPLSTIQDFAYKAYMDLSSDPSFPEFGEETRMAICDTAGDALTDAGFIFQRDTLRAVADKLA